MIVRRVGEGSAVEGGPLLVVMIFQLHLGACLVCHCWVKCDAFLPFGAFHSLSLHFYGGVALAGRQDVLFMFCLSGFLCYIS